MAPPRAVRSDWDFTSRRRGLPARLATRPWQGSLSIGRKSPKPLENGQCECSAGAGLALDFGQPSQHLGELFRNMQPQRCHAKHLKLGRTTSSVNIRRTRLIHIKPRPFVADGTAKQTVFSVLHRDHLSRLYSSREVCTGWANACDQGFVTTVLPRTSVNSKTPAVELLHYTLSCSHFLSAHGGG